MSNKDQIEPELPSLVLPAGVIRVMREEGREPGVDNHYEYLMEYLCGTPQLQTGRKKMTHQQLVELQRDCYRLERQARNRQFDEESYEPHEQVWFAKVADTLRRVFPLVDDAQRKAGRREKVAEDK